MNDLRTFLIMGPPGSGKGTQAKLLGQKLGAEVYSTGERCREFAKIPTYFGGRVKEVIESGDLMPEWFSMYLFEDKLVHLEPQDTVVFEGSGRKVLEAHAFDGAMEWLRRPYKVVFLNVNEAALRERLEKRRHIEKRADDELKTLDTRFARFREHTEPAVAFFRSRGVVTDIDGGQGIEEVHQTILKTLAL